MTMTRQSTRAKLALVLLACGAWACASAPTREANRENYMLQGYHYANDGLLREAEAAYKKALAQSPNNLSAHRNIGIVYVKTGDYAKAVKHLEKAIRKYADDYDTNFFLAEAYRMREKHEEAIFRYKKALKADPKSDKSLKALAWSYYQVRFYSEALKTATRLVKVAPDDMQAAVILARVHAKMNAPAKALAVVKDAMVHANKSELPYLQSVEGDILLAMKKHPEAQNAYRAALKDQPLLAGALLGLGISMWETGQRPDMATEYMERAVRIKPKLADGLYYLGKAYQKTNPEKSAKFFRLYVRKAGSDPEALAKITESKDKLAQLEAGAAAANATPPAAATANAVTTTPPTAKAPASPATTRK